MNEDAKDSEIQAPVWLDPDGEPVSRIEKIKVLNENLEKIREMSQDALEDAVPMDRDEAQPRRILAGMVASLVNPYRKSSRPMFRAPPRIRSALLACAAGLVVAAPLVGAPRQGAAETWNQNGVAVLQGLDKVTARIFTFDAPLDQPVPFGTLLITARACQKRPPEEPPESAAFLEIDEQTRGQDPASVFSGWMFASSPALSALEHAVYDVWVIDCRNRSSAASSSSK